MKYAPASSSKFFSVKNSQQLKILHLGDLLIDAEGKENEGAFDKLVVQLQNVLLDRKIDYLVIKGNLTMSGTIQSFERAFEVINNLAFKLLKRDKESQVISLSRIIIVPGKKDIPITTDGEPDYRSFIAFWEKFFSPREYNGLTLQAKAPVDFRSSHPDCRDLIDITMLAIPHWLLGNKNISFEEALKQTRSAEEIEYINATPTILITHDLGEHLDEKSKNLNARFFRKINTTLQLMGATGDLMVPSRNDVIKHMSVGTGKLTEKEPLKATLIYLRPYSSNKPKLRIDNWDYQRDLQVWQRDFRVNGKQDLWLPKYKSQIQIQPIYDQQIRQMLNECVTKNLVVVKGFPGSGKEEFYEYLKSNHPDCLHMEFPYDIMDAVDELNKLLEKNRESNKTIVVIRDPYFHHRKSDQQEKHIENFRKAFGMLGKHSSGVLYFYSSAGSEKDDKLFSRIRNGYGSIKIDRLTRDSFQQLFTQYSKFIPVNSSSIQKLSGSFAGYSRLLLNSILDKYLSEVYNHNIINYDYCEDLLANAIQNSNELTVESKIFKKAITDVYGGITILKLIEETIYKKTGNWNGSARGLRFPRSFLKDLSIKIDLNVIESEEKKQKMRVAIKALGDVKIFTQNMEDENVFHLNVIIPFLINQPKPTFEEREF